MSKLIKIALIGKTNSGKSTLINNIVGEKISIINKKINTTQESLIGIRNYKNIQIIIYDTPGINFLKVSKTFNKNLKINLWSSIDEADILIYMLDILRFNYKNIIQDIKKLSEVKKPILLLFNKIDLVDKNEILPKIDLLKDIQNITSFLSISAKKNLGINKLIKFISLKSYNSKWIYQNNEISNKDDIYITNECTRNAILKFLHKEIPYNIKIKNTLFKYLKNNDLKIKQSIELDNKRYKPIILGKNGNTIKRIRECSQKDIKSIINNNIHLYLQIDTKNAK